MQEPWHGQVITSLLLEEGVVGFNPLQTILKAPRWRKREASFYMELGITQKMTFLFSVTQQSLYQGEPYRSRSAGRGPLVLGSRFKLLEWQGWIFSTESTWRFPAPSQAYIPWFSPDGVGGKDIRLLLARSFTFWDQSAFVDLQVGYRSYHTYFSPELRLDITWGLSLNKQFGLMLQGFGLITRPSIFNKQERSLKIQPSLVWQAHPRVSLQIAPYVSVTKRYNTRSRGMIVSAWYKF